MPRSRQPLPSGVSIIDIPSDLDRDDVFEVIDQNISDTNSVMVLRTQVLVDESELRADELQRALNAASHIDIDDAIRNMTKAQISSLLREMVDNMPDDISQDILRDHL